MARMVPWSFGCLWRGDLSDNCHFDRGANTAFADFPRLCALRGRWLFARQLTFSVAGFFVGYFVLALMSILLITSSGQDDSADPTL